MTYFKPKLRLITLLGLISSGMILVNSTYAQTDLPLDILNVLLPSQWEFRPPGDLGKPGNREGGATRSPQSGDRASCLSANQKLIALVPPSGEALTTAPYPTFFWYLPETSAESLEFIVRDNQNLVVYSTRYPLAKANATGQFSAKILHLTLPAFAGVEPLQVDREYHWQLNLICNSDESFHNISVKANIKRVLPDTTLIANLSTASSTEKVALYAEARLWHETLTSLLELSRSNPGDPNLDAVWRKLLTSVGLENISQNSWSSSINF